jgi:Flp pilus assembly protein TadG
MTRRRHGSRTRSMTRAQAMVEFALVAPMFFLVLFAIIEAGRFIFYYETLSHATREGARYAIVNGANTLGCPSGPAAPGSSACDTAGNNVVTRVRQSALGVPATGVSVDRCWWYSACDFGTHGDGDNARGATVTVNATYTYSSLIPLVPLPSITVTAESSLVINN